ncbi:MAG: phosphate ABC transporter permease PstA [Elusimicrobiota bacterium]|jgi:phosphate transport system permease protein|nr:phosphate ABC transporter permease PstA [Elusimicrobiota bacterium]
MKNKIIQQVSFLLIGACILITLFFLASLIYFIAKNGLPVLSWSFLTQPPKDAMSSGGVAPAIIGTFYLTLGAIIIAAPLGLACAIYLQEYCQKGTVASIIKIGVNNLAGVPSVVFGLFGLTFFVKFLGFGISILSGALTLAILILPSIISASCEALNAVPNSIREASLALGATQFQTIRKAVLPCAFGAVMTGIILSIARAAGETAPILFTAAAFYKRGYPDSIFSETMALPYHIYALMTEGTNPAKQEPIAYGCALILMLMVFIISLAAIFLRNKYRRKNG